MLPPRHSEDLRRIILAQQLHYAECIQKIIGIIQDSTKVAAILQLATLYGIDKQVEEETKINQYGHLELDELQFEILKHLRECAPRKVYGRELRMRIGVNKIYDPIWYEAMRDLQFYKKIKRNGTGGGITYQYNEMNDEEAAS